MGGLEKGAMGPFFSVFLGKVGSRTGAASEAGG